MTIVRDVSLIILAVEAFIIALIPLALVGALAYGLWWLRQHRNLPRWLQLARAYVFLGQAHVERAMAAVVRPIFWIRGKQAKVQAWLRHIGNLGR